jgi:hypothetical protein
MGNRSAPDIKNRFQSVRHRINKKSREARELPPAQEKPPSQEPLPAPAAEPPAVANQSRPRVKKIAVEGGKKAHKAGESAETPQAQGAEFSIQNILL